MVDFPHVYMCVLFDYCMCYVLILNPKPLPANLLIGKVQAGAMVGGRHLGGARPLLESL